MEAQEQIKRFHEFLESNYHIKLLEKIRKGLSYLVVDFSELLKFDPELSEAMLENPDETIKAAELAVQEFDIPSAKFKIRFSNLPETQRILIRNVRSSHLNKFLVIEGVVRQKSDVRPQVTSAKFECPSCGNIINVLQLDSSFKEPSRCGCGRKGKFHLISKELVDAQGLVLEEAPEQLEGGEQPKRINVFLKDDLVSPMSEKRTNPGSKVRVIGQIKEVPIILRTGVKSTRFDLLIEANYVEAIEESFYELLISEEEEKQILELAKDRRIFERLRDSMAPSIYGHERVKEALLLQLMGGIHKTRKDGIMTRGDIHVLLVGDPGAGKSALLKRINIIAPKGRYVSGKGVSAAGLTATVVRDEFLRGWSLEAGAMVLASNGICCTTGDTEFITEDYKKLTFEELFKTAKKDVICPKFRVLALNTKTNKVEPFKIKRAFRIKNDKNVYRIKTRTGRAINLTEDNEVLITKNSEEKWIEVQNLKKGDYIAVQNKFPLEKKDGYSREFAYVCGLIASDGHIKIDNRHAQTSFYNSDKRLVLIFKKTLEDLNVRYGVHAQKKGRKSKIRGKEVTTKKDMFKVYNSQKSFAQKLINFGIPKGNKSKTNPLNDKILAYSNKTLIAFMKGIFDGDGSIRKNPFEITLTAGLKKNAKLFQEVLLRFNIISSVKKSTNSWHCNISGTNRCLTFFDLVGTNHPAKFEKFSKIKSCEVKDRIDVLPNHQDFFKHIIKKHRWRLGKEVYRYIWNYTKNKVCPSKYKLRELNRFIQDKELAEKINNDVLWDKIISIKKIDAEYVYDFTMEGTHNFIANNIIMHNCIDELDKMSVEDRAAMHEALENQTVSISKANIQATLIARTTVLAAANPKFGRFDPYDILAKQIDLPPTLINRFDLIFPIKDLPEKTRDEEMAGHMLGLHQRPDIQSPDIPTDILKKYLAYAKQKSHPQLTDGAIEEIKAYYVQMRNKEGVEEGAARAIPISPRQLEALVRLAEANAKIRLSTRVTRKDARKAIELLHYCLKQIGIDPETGKIDIDRISTGVTASQRSRIITIKEIIGELENRIGKTIPIEDIVREAALRKIDEADIDDALEKLKRSGDIFEPKRGFVQRI
jgi:replicative DNA helicase Mcm